MKPVCLPSVESSQTYTGQTAVVSGWGLTDYYNGTFPDHLQHVRVDILGKSCGELSDFRQPDWSSGNYCCSCSFSFSSSFSCCQHQHDPGYGEHREAS